MIVEIFIIVISFINWNYCNVTSFLACIYVLAQLPTAKDRLPFSYFTKETITSAMLDFSKLHEEKNLSRNVW